MFRNTKIVANMMFRNTKSFAFEWTCEKRPFHRDYSPVHSKWTKWTSKWTSFCLHASFAFITFARKWKQIRDHPWWNHPLSSVVLFPLRSESVPADRAAKKSAHNGTSFKKIAYLCKRESHYVISPRGRQTSFDPSENLENSTYMGEKFEGCSTCNAYA